jgi:hypothetical protein
VGGGILFCLFIADCDSLSQQYARSVCSPQYNAAAKGVRVYKVNGSSDGLYKRDSSRDLFRFPNVSLLLLEVMCKLCIGKQAQELRNMASADEVGDEFRSWTES